MIVPFGKYKGCHVAKLKADRSYTRWLLAQDWFTEKWPRLAEAIGNPAKAATATAHAPATSCPAGHVFGRDRDRFQACEVCPIWDACSYAPQTSAPAPQTPAPAPQAPAMNAASVPLAEHKTKQPWTKQARTKFRPMSTETVQQLIATWPRPLTVLATRLAALPIDDAKASTTSPYAVQSFLLALDELKLNLSALKALQIIVYELEYRPDARELLYLVDRALDVRVEFGRLRQTWGSMRAEAVATPRFGFRRGV